MHLSVSLHLLLCCIVQMPKPFPTSTSSPPQFTKRSGRSTVVLAETETPQTCCGAVPAPTGRGPAQHAAVATAPCFLMEVRNAGMSLLIPVEGDGIGRRDRGVRERERAGFPPHPSLFTQALPPHPGPGFTHRLSYMTVFMDCSPPPANDSEGIRERTGRN